MSERSVFRGRKLTVTDDMLVGEGACSKVYAIAEDTVVKVLKISDMSEAEREIKLAKWAIKNGIPTPISYDVVDVDGHPGLVYESLGRGNLRNALKAHPEQFDELTDDYVKLLHTINGVKVDDDRFPRTSDIFRTRLRKIKDELTDAEYSRINELMDTIPESDRLIHGDCHIKNVRVKDGALFLIDLDTLSRGDPIFEFAGIHCAYVGFNILEGGVYDSFFDVPSKLLFDLMDELCARYFADLSAEELEDNKAKISLLAYVDMIYNAVIYRQGDDEALALMKKCLREYLPQVNDLKLKY